MGNTQRNKFGGLSDRQLKQEIINIISLNRTIGSDSETEYYTRIVIGYEDGKAYSYESEEVRTITTNYTSISLREKSNDIDGILKVIKDRGLINTIINFDLINLDIHSQFPASVSKKLLNATVNKRQILLQVKNGNNLLNSGFPFRGYNFSTLPAKQVSDTGRGIVISFNSKKEGIDYRIIYNLYKECGIDTLKQGLSYRYNGNSFTSSCGYLSDDNDFLIDILENFRKKDAPFLGGLLRQENDNGVSVMMMLCKYSYWFYEDPIIKMLKLCSKNGLNHHFRVVDNDTRTLLFLCNDFKKHIFKIFNDKFSLKEQVKLFALLLAHSLNKKTEKEISSLLTDFIKNNKKTKGVLEEVVMEAFLVKSNSLVFSFSKKLAKKFKVQFFNDLSLKWSKLLSNNNKELIKVLIKKKGKQCLFDHNKKGKVPLEIALKYDTSQELLVYIAKKMGTEFFLQKENYKYLHLAINVTKETKNKDFLNFLLSIFLGTNTKNALSSITSIDEYGDNILHKLLDNNMLDGSALQGLLELVLTEGSFNPLLSQNKFQQTPLMRMILAKNIKGALMIIKVIIKVVPEDFDELFIDTKIVPSIIRFCPNLIYKITDELESSEFKNILIRAFVNNKFITSKKSIKDVSSLDVLCVYQEKDELALTNNYFRKMETMLKLERLDRDTDRSKELIQDQLLCLKK